MKKEKLKVNLRTLEALTGGFKTGELYIIAGYHGVGKTSFACDLARRLTEFNLVYGGYFSYEHTEKQIEEDFGVKCNKQISIDDTVRPLNDLFLPIEGAFEYYREFEEPLSFAIFDYFQLLSFDARKNQKPFGHKEEQIAIIKHLKKLAKKHNVCIILMSDLLTDDDEDNQHKNYIIKDYDISKLTKNVIYMANVKNSLETVGYTPEGYKEDDQNLYFFFYDKNKNLQSFHYLQEGIKKDFQLQEDNNQPWRYSNYIRIIGDKYISASIIQRYVHMNFPNAKKIIDDLLKLKAIKPYKNRYKIVNIRRYKEYGQKTFLNKKMIKDKSF